MTKVLTEKLYSVFRDFYNLTGFKIVLFDSSRTPIAAYPQRMCRFCDEVRHSPVLKERCFECDRLGFDTVDETAKSYIYRCHMSATEAIAPIFAGEKIAGYLMFGQIVNTDRDLISDIARKANENYSISISDDMIDEMRFVDEKYLASAANMLSLCASYLYTNEIVVLDPDVLAHRISAHVDENIKDVSLESICRRFYISRSRLYSVSKESFGVGISDYIRKRRLELSKKLLRSSSMSIFEIAEEIGMKNANYFIRTFKASEGVTPLGYRKKANICQ